MAKANGGFAGKNIEVFIIELNYIENYSWHSYPTPNKSCIEALELWHKSKN